MNFVKHELKGVLKYRGKKSRPLPPTDVTIDTLETVPYTLATPPPSIPPHQTATDIAAKSNSTVGILSKAIIFKIPAFGPFPRNML